MDPKHTSEKAGAEFYVGDCRKVLMTFESDQIDLIFADPPFNLGVKYGVKKPYDDAMTHADYVVFTQGWLHACVRVLRPGGTIFVHVPDQIVALAYTVLSRVCDFRNWIVLHQEFGQYGEGRLISSHVHCLYFTKPGGPVTFNVKEVLEPSLRLRIGDKRVKTAKHKGMRPFLDVWYGEFLGRVQGNNRERRPGHPNQLPEMYLARLIRMASNKGDLVLDPFIGSGTTPVVAAALDRSFVGCELVPELAKSAWDRTTRKGPVRKVAGKLWSPSHASKAT